MAEIGPPDEVFSAPLPIPKKDLLSLEHPCIIHNLQRAVTSLGGEAQLSHLLNYKENYVSKSIPVSLRPEDRYAAPIPSTQIKTSNMLIKITVPKRTGRKRKRGSGDPFSYANLPQPTSGRSDAKIVFKSVHDNKTRMKTAVVGIVQNTHRYRTITQFQYSASTNPFLQYMKDNLLSNDYKNIKAFTLDPAQLLKAGQEVQPPPVLQLTDVPFPYAYRQNASVRIFKDQTGVDQSINVARPKGITHSLVNYDVVQVPSGPVSALPPEDEQPMKIRRMIRILRDGLQERPVMSTRYQCYVTNESLHGSLRRALPYVGYMFRGGPFKDALIRYGVDPRSDPIYRGFQVTQVQIPGTGDKKMQRFGHGPPTTKGKPKTYIFDGTELYTDAKVFHFCDLQDPVLRQLLDNAPVAEKWEPFTFGWYNNGTWAMMRVVLKDKIDRLMSGNFKSQEWYEQVVDGFPDVVEEMVVPANRALALKDREMAALLAKARSTARTAKTATMSGRVRRKKRGEGTAENSDEGDETDDVNDVGVFDDPNGDELGDDIDDIEEADFSQ